MGLTSKTAKSFPKKRKKIINLLKEKKFVAKKDNHKNILKQFKRKRKKYKYKYKIKNI